MKPKGADKARKRPEADKAARPGRDTSRPQPQADKARKRPEGTQVALDHG